MIWPTCSMVKLTGEHVGLVPRIQHLIRNCLHTWKQHGKEIKRFFTNMKTEAEVSC